MLEVFKLDAAPSTAIVKKYKNNQNGKTQYLSPDQVRAKWLLLKE